MKQGIEKLEREMERNHAANKLAINGRMIESQTNETDETNWKGWNRDRDRN
jgi:hypothetical protein